MRNGEHLSASQRHIRDLENYIVELEQLRTEFFLLLNHLIKRNGGVYRLYRNDMLANGIPQPVKALKGKDEILGDYIEWTLIDLPEILHGRANN